MDENVKDILRHVVTGSTLRNVQVAFIKYEPIQDDSFFDYELLKAALERKHISIINFLLKQGCRVKNPNKVNKEETALHLAMKVDNAGIIKKMLKNGASIDDKNHNGETALYTGFIGGYRNAIDEALTFVSTITRKHLEEFLDPNFKGLDPTNVDNIIHFQIACVTGHYDAVNYYLQYKFDVNSPLILNSTKYFGSNPLHYAATNGFNFAKLFGILLEKGGDLSIKNSNGKTPLQLLYYSHFTTFNNYVIEQVFFKGNNTKFINSVDNNGVSHFHMCCAINSSEYVQVFIDRGVNVNTAISSNCSIHPGYTPLHIAVMNGCEKVVHLLLKNGADCKERSTEGTTPLHLACKLNNAKVRFTIVQMLLKYNACPAAVDKDNCTPLHLAFLHVNLCEETEVLDMLISKIPREVNFTDNQGLSHFHIVCIRNNISQINDFLQSGVDVNSCVKSEKYGGYTALHFAVLYNHKDVVEILLKWNAQVNTQTNESQLTPLHLACNFNHKKFHEINVRDNKSASSGWISNRKSQLEIIKLLLLHGADVDARDSLGKTPLLNVCTIDLSYYKSNSSEINIRIKQIIEILLLNKANVNACTNSQDSILHIMSENTCLKKSEELVEYLLTKGANVNAVNNHGFTPLHVAVKSYKKELVQVFLKYQADVNAESKHFLIPLQMIVQHNVIYPYLSYIPNNSNDVVCILLENDSHVNVRNENGKTLLQNAIEAHNIFVIKKLLHYGADINMDDVFGNSSVFSLYEWENKSVNNWVENKLYALAFQTIFIHVQKLLALGLYVSEKVQACCKKLHGLYQSALLFPSEAHSLRSLHDVFDNCLEELDKMKLIKIDNYTSLYNILLKDAHEISKHVRNSTLVQILKDPNHENNFPLYSYLLKLKYKDGLKRSDVLKLAKVALPYAIKLNLPDLCNDSILKYLSNEDIINLKAAVKNNHKRKLNIDASSDEEPSAAKLTKKY